MDSLFAALAVDDEEPSPAPKAVAEAGDGKKGKKKKGADIDALFAALEVSTRYFGVLCGSVRSAWHGVPTGPPLLESAAPLMNDTRIEFEFRSGKHVVVNFKNSKKSKILESRSLP